MLLAQNQQLRGKIVEDIQFFSVVNFGFWVVAQMAKSSLSSSGISEEQHQHVVRGRDVIIHRLSTESMRPSNITCANLCIILFD